MRTIRNCRVAVIGGAGFLGSHLVNHLIDDRGCQVLVVDNLCVGRREFVHHDADFEHADIAGSESHLRKLFETYKCRFVFNYAAWPYVPDCFDRPLHVFAVNATGAIQCINAAQEAGVEAILQVSSAELYGDGPDIHIEDFDTRDMIDEKFANKELDESAPVSPHSTYGAAKAAVDYYCQTAWRERKTPAIALRQFNCVGERETHPYVIPEIIGQLWKCKKANGKEFLAKERSGADVGIIGSVRLGNNSTRDFLYAGDAVRIAVELLERGQFGEVYNLGSETGIKIYDLAKLIGKVMGFMDVHVEEDASRKRPWEVWMLRADVSKIAKVVGPGSILGMGLVPLEDALRRTVKWFEENGRKWPWE